MRSFTIDAGGPVFVADFGGSGPPMVLLHGLGGSHLNWMSVGPSLAREYHVLAPDLPGFGRTPSAGRQASIAANTRVLETIVTRVGEGRAFLMGNSMGGLISLGLAATRADLLSALVLVDAALPIPRDVELRLNPVTLRFLLAYLAPRVGEYFFGRLAGSLGAEGLVRTTLERCTVDISRLDPLMVAAMIDLERERMTQPDWHDAVLQGSRSIVQALLIPSRLEHWIQLVATPTLLLHGREDRVMTVRAARAAADLRPDWEYVELADVGHVPMMEMPEEFLAATGDWLRRTRSAAHRAPPPQTRGAGGLISAAPG